MDKITDQKTASEESPKMNHFLVEAQLLFSGKKNEYGPIEHPNKRGLVALANKGYLIWNAWRDAYPDIDIDLSDVDFVSNPINFSKFKFTSIFRPNKKKSHKTIFRGAKFGSETDFSGAEFSDITIFDHCAFSGDVDFSASVFGVYRGGIEDRPKGIASFENCLFEKKANFSDAAFIFSCTFVKCSFGERSSFKRTQFTWVSYFQDCRFGLDCSFRNAVFSNASSFTKSMFEPGINFTFCVFFGNCNFEEAIFKESAKFVFSYFGRESNFLNSSLGHQSSFEGSIFVGDVCFASSQDNNAILNFSSISFCGAQFRSKADFSGRNFLLKTDFGPTTSSVTLPENNYLLWNKYRYVKAQRPVIFYGIVSFHNSKFQQDTSFEASEFHDFSNGDTARAYRTLKILMEQLKATREEQRFFRLEMKAEKPTLKGWKWFFSTIYEWCSDYGYSVWRPVICLLLTSVLIGSAHGTLCNISAGVTWPAAVFPVMGEVNSSRTHAMWKYAAINSIPVPGLDKAQQILRDDLFESKKSPKISTIALVLEIIHKVISLVMSFLIGLALRNLFKMKT